QAEPAGQRGGADRCGLAPDDTLRTGRLRIHLHPPPHRLGLGHAAAPPARHRRVAGASTRSIQCTVSRTPSCRTLLLPPSSASALASTNGVSETLRAIRKSMPTPTAPTSPEELRVRSACS